MDTSKSNRPSAKAAHVNMMTDTIIANLPPEALRSIVRGLLGIDSKVTPAFHDLASKYLADTKPRSMPILFADRLENTLFLSTFDKFRNRYRCLMGCGQGFETLQALAEVIKQAQEVISNPSPAESENFDVILTNVDSDLVQAVTAVQKELSTSSGMRSISDAEIQTIRNLKNALLDFEKISMSQNKDFPIQRGMSRLEMLHISDDHAPENGQTKAMSKTFTSIESELETVILGKASVPRMFMGLWQFSSPAWGTASRSKIDADFRKHVDAGLIAYDMADHYGDAEITFVCYTFTASLGKY
jgi:hypothetical protein